VRLPVDALTQELSPPLVLTGPGLTVYEDFLRDRLDPAILPAPLEVRYPRASTVARLARALISAGQTVPPHRLTPAYLRPAL
jgi:hypothetical protein